MQVVLVMFKSDGERRSFSLPKAVTLIGRREDCDLRIPLSDVSRKHCRFIRDDNAVRIEDLGSSNGTFHNGVRVQEAIVQPGDQVQVGPVVFIVQIDGVPADNEIQPPAPHVMAGETGVAPVPDELPADLGSMAGAVADQDIIEDLVDLDAGAIVEEDTPPNPPLPPLPK